MLSKDVLWNGRSYRCHIFQKDGEVLPVVDLFFYGSSCKQTVDSDLFHLSDTPRPLSRLHVRTWVPVRIVDDDPVRPRQIDPEASHPSCQKEQKNRRILRRFIIIIIIIVTVIIIIFFIIMSIIIIIIVTVIIIIFVIIMSNIVMWLPWCTVSCEAWDSNQKQNSFPMPVPLANSARMSTQTLHCPREDQIARERTDHSSSSAPEAKWDEVASTNNSKWQLPLRSSKELSASLLVRL